jgi:hypothetical protein
VSRLAAPFGRTSKLELAHPAEKPTTHMKTI